MKKWRIPAVVGTVGALAPAAVIATAEPANAFGGDFFWDNNGIVLGQGSNANVVGFWQAIIASNHICPVQDGIFGTETRSYTISWQGDLGITADGIVGSSTWKATQWATDAVFGNRLSDNGSGFYSYYGGGAVTASLWWQSGYDWKFQQTGQFSPGTWYGAVTYTNTMTPYDADTTC
jgi:peptidoglycan hydrolase-like protein with peptidoglycan-binding domain